MKQGVLLLLRCTVLFCQMPGWERETSLSAKQLIRANCQVFIFFSYFRQMERRCFIMLNKVGSHCCVIHRLQILFLTEVTHK